MILPIKPILLSGAFERQAQLFQNPMPLTLQYRRNMKVLLAATLLLLTTANLRAQTAAAYVPTAANEAARQDFQDRRFGMFIHWGASSVLGAGEWVMNNRN